MYRWRIQYDEGKIKYSYRYTDLDNVNKVVWFFRVWVRLGILEIMCTDMRCPDLVAVPYAQRVLEMNNFPTDEFVKIVYNIIVTQWYPCKPGAGDTGVDDVKFWKFIRDIKCFPDIKLDARKSQLDSLYFSLLTKRKKHNIIEKTNLIRSLDFAYFITLLHKIALIRYPPPPGSAIGKL